MPGLYVHIPFCARRCPYCDFAVSVDQRLSARADYLRAVRAELAAAGQVWPGAPLQTIFIGGGTPTELPYADLNALLQDVSRTFAVAPNAEITLEANPEHLSPVYLEGLWKGGFNRLSLGAQSLVGPELQLLGRRHQPQDVVQAVGDARLIGFRNISLDLIYALPGTPLPTGLGNWRASLEAAVALDVPHVSAYSLTIEAGTEFGRRARQGLLVPRDDDEQASYMDLAHEILEQGGVARYEVSNYARPGFTSRHNQNYWSGGNYIALGAGAHGHRDGHRWWNERSTPRYVRRMLAEGTAITGEEHLTPQERLEEAVALGLRCTAGFNLSALSGTLHMDVPAALNGRLQRASANGWISLNGDTVTPRPDKLALADAVAGQVLA